MKKVLLGAAICFGMQFAWAEALLPGPDDVIIEVRAGDTLGDLARTRMDEPTRWRDVANYNLLPDPNLIEPGQQLRIKRIWLKATAGALKVEAVTGEATANGKLLKAGDTIPAGARVLTADGAALRLRMQDASLVNVMERSELKVEKLEQRADNVFSSLLRLVVGQIDAFKTKHAAGKADLAVAGRNATVGIRGTHFRVRQDGVVTFTEVEEGTVSFDATQTPLVLALNAREGSVANGRDAAQVVPLLSEPVYPELSASFNTPYIEWTMGELAGAQRYVGELAQDEAFSDKLVSIRSDGRTIRLNELPNGRYWLKLRAVDEHGLQGMEGRIGFEVNVPPRRFAMTKVYVSGKQLQLRWVGRKQSVSYQVQVATRQDFQRPLLDVGTADNWVDMARPQSGRYFMRVRQIFAGGRAGEWDVPMMFDAP
ncbi:MAG: FecR domain-containing protein [Sideroxydans sp.]|nr:FecR domain-containing protein [Sideroxydans sp.]